MKNLHLLLLLPFGLWANTPASIMSPKIYELTDYIEPGQSVISMISNEGGRPPVRHAVVSDD